MSTPAKTSAGLVPAVILAVIAAVMLLDWNINGGFGLLTRIVAWGGGALFILLVVLAVVRTNKADKL